jgi:ketosteroid isomerase-like protein
MTSSSNRTVAEAFSGHRFSEAYDHLAPDISWLFPGESPLEGKDAVVAACESTLAELASTDTEFTRFVSVADDQTAVVDAIGRYVEPDGATSVVSSCDIYEFRDDQIAQITSYTVEVEPHR